MDGIFNVLKWEDKKKTFRETSIKCVQEKRTELISVCAIVSTKFMLFIMSV